MASTREVLTFQFGNYSNYVGAHWWNIQESYFQYDEKNPSEICHDVLFREGKTLSGHPTFTPRLIVVDSSENIGNLSVLSENSSETLPEFSERVESISKIEEKHEFINDLEKISAGVSVDIKHKNYDFNSTVRGWYDFLKTKYHPKSICGYTSNYKNDMFNCGSYLFKALDNDFTEKIRSYMEECDNLQGFQIIVDAVDGSAGFANMGLIHLNDEYPSKSIFTVPVISNYLPVGNPLNTVKLTVNILLAYHKLTENSNLLVPVGTNAHAWRSLGPPVKLPNVIYDHTSSYQSSAILASFLDTVTLKFRLRESCYSINDLISGLNYYNKKICSASISLPFPIKPESYLLDTLENLDDDKCLWTSLTPGCNVNEDSVYYQKITVRGISTDRLKNPSVNKDNRAYNCSDVGELIHLYLLYRSSAVSDVTSAKTPLKTDIPYPKIFSPQVLSDGGVDETYTRSDDHSVNRCPVITGLHCSKGVGQMLDSLYRAVKAVNVDQYRRLLDPDIDMDEFKECLDKILSM